MRAASVEYTQRNEMNLMMRSAVRNSVLQCILEFSSDDGTG